MAELKIGIGADNSGLSKGLRDAEAQITAFVSKIEKIAQVGEKLSSIGQKMSVGLTLPLVAAGTAAYMMAADFEDALGATTQIFKESSDAVQKWANKLPSYYGIAKKEALEYSNMMGSMLKNIGGLTDQEASRQSAKLIELAGDLTAMYGGTTADAVYALTGALKGNNTMLDNYGMAANDALVKAKALEMGLVSQGKEMSLAAKQAATLALIYDQAGAATGQAAREAGGASGSMRALKTEIKNLTAELGENLLPIIAPITQKLQELIAGFRDLSPQVKQVIVSVGLAVAAAGPLLVVVGGLMAALPSIIAGFGAVKIALVALTGPIGLVVVGVGAIIAAVVSNWDKITPYIRGTVEWFKRLYNESGLLRGAVNLIGLTFKAAFSVVGDILTGVWRSIKAFGKGILELFAGIGGVIEGALTLDFDKIKAGYSRGFGAIMGTASSFVTVFKDTVKNIGNSILNPTLSLPNINVSSSIDPSLPDKVADVVSGEVAKGLKKVKGKPVELQIPIKVTIPAMAGLAESNPLSWLFSEDQLAIFKDRINNSVVPTVEGTITDAMVAIQNRAIEFNDSVNLMLQDNFVNMFAGIGEALMTGASIMEIGRNAVLNTLGQFAIMFGKELVKTAAIAEVFGGLIIAIEKAITNPYALLAIAAAAIVVGSALSASAKRTSSVGRGGGGYSSGGISTGAGGGVANYTSSYSTGTGSNNEFRFVIMGDDLYSVMERAKAKHERLS